jgi:hypothetical protein
LAYNFNDDSLSGAPGGAAPASTTAAERHDASDAPAHAGSAPVAEPAAPGAARFNSCRWQQPKEEGIAAFCTHREVKPYAGSASFDPEAWCPECQYYKLRRAPKKRNPAEDYSY